MNILIVGAGAVGSVYGRHFQLGGAKVSFLVREKYADSIRSGFRFYFLNRPKSSRYSPIEMKQFGVLTQAQEVAREKWDYVVLSMSSTGLRGPWLEELIHAMGDAILVTLQPGLEDREYILQRLNAARLIEGMIPITSYQAPLPGEKVPAPGIAYWFPPASPGPFSGPKDSVQRLVEVLKKGGFPAKASKNVNQESLIPSTVLTLIIAALEASHWSFDELSRGPELKLACRAIPEALRIVSRRRGQTPPVILPFLLKPALFRLIISLSRWIIPFDFQAFLKVHFTKVQEQMHQGMKDYLELAKKHSLPAQSLTQLQGHVLAVN